MCAIWLHFSFSFLFHHLCTPWRLSFHVLRFRVNCLCFWFWVSLMPVWPMGNFSHIFLPLYAITQHVTITRMLWRKLLHRVITPLDDSWEKRDTSLWGNENERNYGSERRSILSLDVILWQTLHTPCDNGCTQWHLCPPLKSVNPLHTNPLASLTSLINRIKIEIKKH